MDGASRCAPGGRRAGKPACRTGACALVLAGLACAAAAAANEPNPKVATGTWHQLLSCVPGEASADGAQVYTCAYVAPAGCRILSATATPIGGPEGSLEVTIAADGRRLVSVITASPLEVSVERKPAHPLISITAKLECDQ